MSIKIYTKTGDKGTTSLIGGKKIFKNHPQIEAYGTIDELNACLGIILSGKMDDRSRLFLKGVQEDLFVIGSQLAAPKRTKFVLPILPKNRVEEMEREIDFLSEGLPPLKNFILPGGDIVSSHIHLARCVCRRAERVCVGIKEDIKGEVYGFVIIYLNRLSDYLFTLGRYYNNSNNIKETIWKG